jgi:hypothetical protein
MHFPFEIIIWDTKVHVREFLSLEQPKVEQWSITLDKTFSFSNILHNSASTLWELSVQCMFLGDMEMGRYKVIYTTVTVYTVQ